jgi:hypothetical protein
LSLGICALVQAETLSLAPTDDSYIRASQGNQGSNDLAIVGDTANPDDFLRAVFAFDLDVPELADASITGVTLRLTIDGRDTSSGGSGDEINPIDLHPLGASFTNGGVTWTSRDGTNAWTTPGGDFGGALASVTANAGTVNGGDRLDFSGTDLQAAVEGAIGSPFHLIAKLRTEDAIRSVFRITSKENSTTAHRPALVIEYEPITHDPTLLVDASGGDPDLHFGILSGDLPVTASRSLHLVNQGPTQAITIESAGLAGSSVFGLDEIAINGTGGRSLPATLEVGDSLALTVSATSGEYLSLAEATLTLDTSEPTQDRAQPVSASFLKPGTARPHPAVPGAPASSAYQVRVDGIPVPVNDESAFDFHTAFFSMEDPAMVEVEFLAGVTFSSIHPLRHGIQPRIEGTVISFPLLEPHKLVIKAVGAPPLALCATPNETEVPAPGDPDVIYFGPGTHQPGLIEPVSGQTVYLAPGALVKGRIETRNATGVTIRGRGTLDSRGYSVRADKTNAILFERCSDVHIEGIGIRGGSWWQTLFLLTDDASAIHLSLLGVSVNTDGIDIDGVQRFVARDCFIRCEDDGFGWHAISAEAYGEPPTRDCLAEDCVIWNTRYGNGLRIGASMETELFENITFRNIDVLEHAGAAIYSDHSDWATCRNIRFENFTDETTKQIIDIFIDRTRYSNSTGYRDGRGHYDGLEFINVNSPGGGVRLRGFDADHRIENVLFRDCFRGEQAIDGVEDIVTNEFVAGVAFDVTGEPTPGIDGFRRVEPGDGWLAMGFASRYGRAYSLEAASDLGTGSPFAALLSTTGAGPSTKLLFFDPAMILSPRRFYRVATE